MRYWILYTAMIGILGTESSSAQDFQNQSPSAQRRRSPHVDSLRRVLKLSPNLRLKWLTSRNGEDTLQVTDDFNRDDVGPDWGRNPEFWQILDGELDLTDAAIHSFRYLAAFLPVYNTPDRRIYSVSYRWGRNADWHAITEGSHALMLDRPNANGSGYWLWHRTNWFEVWLWIVKNGTWEYTPGEHKEVDRAPAQARNPRAGDVVTAYIHNEPHEVYFDYYVNNRFDARLKDPTKEYPKSNNWYVGVFLYGWDPDSSKYLTNQVDDFTVTWLEGDIVAPARVADLHAIESTINGVKLEWTSTGDNAFDGNAALIDLRYSTAPIEEDNFDRATRVPDLPEPASSGETQSFAATGLSGNTEYFFALKLLDEADNAGPLSNVVQAKTKGDGVARKLTLVKGCSQTGEVNKTLAAPLTAKVTDRYGVAVSKSPVRFVIISGNGAIGGKKDTTVTTDANGEAKTIWKLGTIAGAQKVKILANGLAGSPDTCTATAEAAAPARLTTASGNRQIVSPGKIAPAPLFARLTDQYGNPNFGRSVTFQIISGGGSFLNGQGAAGKFYQIQTDGSGQAPAQVIAGNAYGDTTHLTAKWTNSTSTSTLVTSFVVTAARPDSLQAIKGNNQIAPAGGALAESLWVKIFDQIGGPVKNYPVTFRVRSGGGKLANNQIQVNVNSDGNGYARTKWTLGPTSGTQQVEAQASFNGKNLRNAPYVFKATAKTGAVSATRSTLIVSPSRSVPADSVTAAVVTVTLRDGFDNPIRGKSVQISVTGTKNYITQPAKSTDSSGTATATIRSSRAEWKTVSAKVLGDNLALAQTAPAQFIASAAKKIQPVSGDKQKASVRKNLPNPVVVQALDKFANPTRQTKVTFKVLAGGGRLIGNSLVTTDSAGLAKATWQMGPAPGLNKLEARVDGLTGSPIVFTATGVDSATAVHEDGTTVPQQFTLHQNFPNPFWSGATSPAHGGGNPETTINFDLPEAGEVEMTVTDMTGRQVRQLLSGQMRAGSHRIIWNGQNDYGRIAESGVYFITLRAKLGRAARQMVATRKVVLMKT